MSESIILYQKEKIPFKEKFYRLMNLITSNRSLTRFESYSFILFFFLQIISSFFANQIGVLNTNQTCDMILNYIYQIIHLKDFLYKYPQIYKLFVFIIAIYLIIFTILFYYCVNSISNNYFELKTIFLVLNKMIKILCFILLNITVDFFTTMICFNREYNPYIKDLKCNQKGNFITFSISGISAIYIFIICFYLEFYYEDSFYLSPSPCSKMTLPLHQYLYFNSVLISILTNLINYFHHGIYFIVNFIISCSLFYYYEKKIIFYDKITCFIFGIFFFEYIWTTLYFFVFYYLDLSHKGLIYVISSLFISYVSCVIINVKKLKIIESTPYHKISNKYYLLFYLRTLIYYIDNISDPIIQSNLIAIMQLHIIECPNECCILKTKDKLYLPLNNEWSDRTKPFIHDKILLKHFIIVVMNYFVSINHYSPEMIINLSHYYLIVIGNICMSLFYYQKVKGMKLTIQEHFLLKRLEIIISGILVEKLKPVNEACFNLNELNISYYFKYFNCAEKFIKSVYSDLDLCLEFWDNYKEDKSQEILDYNKIFHILEKITKSKENVKVLWNKLFNIYSGINDLFDFYLDYVTNINDDSFLSRDLETIKRKNENSIENIQLNYYNLMFNKETGIIIINGNRGNEGKIEKANERAGEIFKYNNEIMRGMNINQLMPKIFAVEHNNYIKKYFETGEKKIINTKGHKIFGIDKDNNILYLSQTIQLFPILNNDIYFISMMINEKVDDLIFIDSDYIIQGMSEKLMNKLNLTNKFLFYDNEIPFYMICKQFLLFYKIFLRDKKKTFRESKNITQLEIKDENDDNSIDDLIIDEDEIKNESEEKNDEMKENVEINENIELEYNIKIPNYLIIYSQSTKTNLPEREFTKDLSLKKIKTSNKERGSIDSKNLDIIEEENSQTILSRNISSQTVQKFNHQNFTLTEHIQSNITPSGTYTKNKNIKKNNKLLNLNDITPNKTPKPKKEQIQRSKSDFVQFLNRTQMPEKECIQKIKNYKNLFKNGKYEQLEHLIENDTKGDNVVTLHFNFTFEIYNYDKNKCIYIIRCIDTKNDNEYSINSYENNPEQEFQYQFQKCRLNNFIYNYEITELEKEIFNSNIINLFKLSIENDSLRELLIKNHKYINEKSKIYGHNHFALQDDENSSQSSSAGYNSDLSKMNRIQEIREKIIENSSKFYTIFYIEIFPICWLFTSIIFIFLYLTHFTELKENLLDLTEYNIILFSVQIQLSQTINTLIELYSMFDFNYFNTTFSVAFTDLNNLTKYEYFETRKNESITLIKDTITQFQKVIYQNTIFLNNDEIQFWKILYVDFYESTFPYQDKETFPICFLSSLVNVLSIFTSNYFTLNHTSDIYTEEILYEILYTKFTSIEESYNTVLPYFVLSNPKIIKYFIHFNQIQLNNLKLCIIIFSVVTFIILGLYTFAVIQTKNNMSNGIIKIQKLTQIQIEDCIKRILIFKNFYSSRFEYFLNSNKLNINKRKDEIENSKNMTAKMRTGLNLSTINKTENLTPVKDEKKNSIINFSFQTKKIKPLRVLNTIYFHYIFVLSISVVLIILMFKYPQNYVNKHKNLMLSHSFLLENFLFISSEILLLHCRLDSCKNNNEYTIYNIIDYDYQSVLFQNIIDFPDFYDFYFNKFLLDLCAAIYDKSDEKYENCKKLDFVLIVNNTYSISTLIDYEINLLLYQNSISKSNESYNPKLLFSSEYYQNAKFIYKNFFLPVINTMNNAVNQSIKKTADEIYRNILICSIILIIVYISNAAYIKIFFSKNLIEKLIVSRSFILIIPTIHIFKTQDLEDWLEQVDKK